MTRFKDGSKYIYLRDEDRCGPHEHVNIGWLDPDHDYTRGEVSPEFVCRLKALLPQVVNRTLGFHLCNLCPPPKEDTPEAWWQAQTQVRDCKGNPHIVGSAEIHVPRKSGIVYAAPDMIPHYVEVHHYRPPDEFIEAVNAFVPTWR